MVIPYVENGNCYIISSFADPNNPLFTTKEEIDDFKMRVEKNLGDLCEVLGYAFHADHFQMLVIIKDRDAFVTFYNNKYKVELNAEEIMDSTYIFSQQVSNVLSGFAKRFNNKHGRFGTLFGRRFTKVLLETEAEIRDWVNRLSKAVRFWTFEELWSWMKNFVKRLKAMRNIKTGLGIWTEDDLVRVREHCRFGRMLTSLESFDLRGSYVVQCLPPHLALKIAK